MLRINQLVRLALLVVFVTLTPVESAMARGEQNFNYKQFWQNLYPNSQSLAAYGGTTGDFVNGCALCHSTTSTSQFNGYGNAILANLTSRFVVRVSESTLQAALNNIVGQKSVSDSGIPTNSDEINANTQPGWKSASNPIFNRSGPLPSSAPPGGITLDPPLNQAPVWNPNPISMTVLEGSPLIFTIHATDQDPNDSLTYSFSAQPSAAGATLNSSTGQFSWTPGFTQAGSYSVTFTVSDGHVTVPAPPITITVTNTNRAPTATILSPPAGTTLFRGVPVAFQGGGADPDGDPVTFNWSFSGATPSISTATVQNPTVTFNTVGTVTVTLTVKDNSNAPSPPVTRTFTVMNPPSAGILQFSATDFRVNESGGSAVITVTRTLGSAGAVGVTLQITGGTATAGLDYTVPSIGQMTVSFANGDTALKTVSIPIINDQMIEGDETVIFTLSPPTGGAVLGTPNTAVLTIVDNPLISIDDVIVKEGQNAVFTVTLSPASDHPVRVNYSTQDGTAVAGTDYIRQSNTLTFSVGETVKTINVVVLADTTPGPNKSFFVNLSGPQGANISRAQGVGRIRSHDNAPMLPADFDGDRKADIAVYRDGTWWILRSSDGGGGSKLWGGAPQDILVPGDYDGDGKTDTAVYRDGTWWILRSSDGVGGSKLWGGAPQDIPVPGDYDGDGKTDMAVYRDGVWWILRSSDGGGMSITWGGAPQDIPVPGDYDGDGKTDTAVYRDGTWWILRSSDGGGVSKLWGGAPQDIPVPGDYDGDGKTDTAVYRDGTWWILRSSDGGGGSKLWGGAPQDIPVPGDYDGDRKTDTAVYRDGTWWILRSSDGGGGSKLWGGAPQDIPLNSD